MEAKHIQRVDLYKLFLKCRNYDITIEEATYQVLQSIDENYRLRLKARK